MKHVHFIGICGTAMATLAVLLKQRGLDVRGSDEHTYPPMSDFLAAHGIVPLQGFRAEHISGDVDTVVIGNALLRGNPEVEAVLDQRVRYVSLPEIVREEFLWTSRPIVVAGTHGKTTTAFMTAWALAEAGADPSFLIGGVSKNFETSGRLGGGGTFVIEGDEYDSAFFDKTAKFLKYLPEIVVVTGVEFDHADIYRDVDELRVAFTRLIRLVPRTGRALLCADDPEAAALRDVAPCAVETFGVAESADWRAADIRHDATATVFEIIHHGRGRHSDDAPAPGDVQRAQCVGRDRRRRGRRCATRDDGRRVESLSRCPPEARGARCGARHHGVRRLRPPSHGGAGNAPGAASDSGRGAHLGRVRATFGDGVSARVSGRVRRGIGGRGRSGRRRGLSVDAA